MDNQHKKITGYRDLSQEEIDLMNEIKAKAEEVGALVEKLGMMGAEVRKDDNSDAPFVPDYRWINIGKTHLQQGFMALVRSIAKPESF